MPSSKSTATPRSPERAVQAAPALIALAPLLSAFLGPAGDVDIAGVADSFGMSKSQLAETIGLAREALYKTTRVHAAKTQSRMREMLEIVSRVAAWAGGKEQAMAWYRAQPIAAFGDRTAEALVKSGQAGALRDYLDHIAMGGFA
jgi:Protein of unknown function (DUF2384)